MHDSVMGNKLSLTLLVAVGFLGGFVARYLAPVSAFAQSRGDKPPVDLVTLQGDKLGEFDLTEGRLKVDPQNISVKVTRNEQSVTMQFSRTQ